MRLETVNCLRKSAAIRFQESRMPGNPLVRFDEGRVGRTARCSPSLLLYREIVAVFRNLLRLSRERILFAEIVTLLREAQ